MEIILKYFKKFHVCSCPHLPLPFTLQVNPFVFFLVCSSSVSFCMCKCMRMCGYMCVCVCVCILISPLSYTKGSIKHYSASCFFPFTVYARALSISVQRYLHNLINTIYMLTTTKLIRSVQTSFLSYRLSRCLLDP